MKFGEFTYKRPDLEELKKHIHNLFEVFKSAKCFEEQNVVIDSINKLREEFSSMEAIASIGYTLDIENKEREEEVLK